jgi:hypothetical protein
MKFFRKGRKDKKAKADPGSGLRSVDESPEVQNAADTTPSRETSQPILVPDKVSATVSEKLEGEISHILSEPPFSVASSPKEALREAAEKLRQRIEKSGMDSKQFEFDPIRGSYDINSLANSLELALDKLMVKTKVPDSNQNVAKAFTKEWVKKSIPFLEKGLAAAEVCLLVYSRLAKQ